MKAKVFGAFGGALIVALVGSLVGNQAPLFAQRSSIYEPASELIALSAQLDNNRQQVVVIDSVRQTMCVYHIDPTTGTPTLKSARNLSADLQLDAYNATDPLPATIRENLPPHRR